MLLTDKHGFTDPLLFISCIRLILCVSSVGSCVLDAHPTIVFCSRCVVGLFI